MAVLGGFACSILYGMVFSRESRGVNKCQGNASCKKGRGREGALMIRRVCFGMLLVLVAWMAMGTRAVPRSPASQRMHQDAAAKCPVTLPNERTRPSEETGIFAPSTLRGKPALRVVLWPDGTVVFTPGGRGSIEPDGSLGMKFPWWREGRLRGKLKIHGKRLDASAPPLRASIPEGYGDTGFQSTALIFPTEGCWEVTGEVGDTSLTFVTRVVRYREPK